MNAVVYCRVSSQEQVDGTSLQSQELACREYARRNQLEVRQVFIDRGESAKFADRPQLLEMISYCTNRANAVDEVLVWKVDRLARNVEDHFSIKTSLLKHKVRVVSVTEPIDTKPEGRLLETILAGFAQFDNDVRAARTVQGMRRKLQEGIYPWQPPLGYQGAAPAGNKKLEPDRPAEPAFGLLKQAWSKFASGNHTKAEILRFLDGNGLRSRTGRRLTSQFIDHFFEDVFYAGILRDPFNGEELPGRHLPMVTKETFDTVQQIIARRNRSIPHLATRPEFPLRGFVRCAGCNRSLTGSFSKGRSRYYAYYHCNNKQCDVASIHPLSDVHEEFRNFLNGIKIRRHCVAHLKSNLRVLHRQSEVQLESAQQRWEADNLQAQKQLKQLIAMKVDGLLSNDEFQEQRSTIDIRLNRARPAPSSETANVVPMLEKLDIAAEFLAVAGNIWEAVPPHFQRRFQQALIPGGYTVGDVGTAPKGRILSFFEAKMPANTNVVPPVGESWNQLAAELEGLASVFREIQGVQR